MFLPDGVDEAVNTLAFHDFLEKVRSCIAAPVRKALLSNPEVVHMQLPSRPEAAWPEYHGRGGWTALHFAAESGHEATVKLLLEAGADRTRKGDDGRIPLHVVSPACVSVRRLLDSKRKNVDTAAEGELLTVTSAYAVSGETLAVLHVRPDIDVRSFKLLLQERLPVGHAVQQLFKDGCLLTDAETLRECNAGDGAALQVAVSSQPVLLLLEPCSFTGLAHRYGIWNYFGEPDDGNRLVERDDVRHHMDISRASAAARSAVLALQAIIPDLQAIDISPSYEAGDDDPRGEVIAIATPGDDPKKACLKALGIRKCLSEDYLEAGVNECVDPKDPECCGVWVEAESEPLDLQSLLARGFNSEEGAFRPPHRNLSAEAQRQILAATAVMVEKLHAHFRFSFGSGVFHAPVVYGGYCADGSIVGVLSTRTVY